MIPANTYGGQTTAVATVAIQNYLVTSESVPADLVYAMTKALFDNLDVMVASHNAAKVISKDLAGKNPPVPLHVGAEKYYKEIGVL
jgi:TRAP transporter TAXI family solute receptor